MTSYKFTSTMYDAILHLTLRYMIVILKKYDKHANHTSKRMVVIQCLYACHTKLYDNHTKQVWHHTFCLQKLYDVILSFSMMSYFNLVYDLGLQMFCILPLGIAICFVKFYCLCMVSGDKNTKRPKRFTTVSLQFGLIYHPIELLVTLCSS
jgi:hypothetical protein